MRAQQHLPWMDFYVNRNFAFVIKSCIMQTRWVAAGLEQVRKLSLKTCCSHLLCGSSNGQGGSGGASPLPAQLHLQRGVQGAAPAAHHASQCLKLQSPAILPPASARVQPWLSAASPRVATRSTKAAPWACRAQPQCPQTHREAAQEARHATPLVIWLVLELPKVSSHLVLLSF